MSSTLRSANLSVNRASLSLSPREVPLSDSQRRAPQHAPNRARAGPIPVVQAAGGPPAYLDLSQVADFLPDLMNAMSDAVLVVDRDQRVVAANRRYLEVFGTGRAPSGGSVCHDVLHCPEESSGGRGRCAACLVIEEAQPRQFLRTLPDASGAVRRWEATFSPILDPAGGVTHVVEVWRDITERSQLEAQISHNERLASLGILAAGVGHEINNPLASVLAGIESLTRWLGRRSIDEPARAEAAEVLGLLEREVGRCREITDKLMLLAQPFSLAPRSVNLSQVAADTLSLLRYEMRKRRIEAVEQLDPALPDIWARDAGMRSVCMNLMMNAVQAMPEGGRLAVTTRQADDGVVLEVADTGPGIPPQHLERIWDPFFTTKPAGQGTGLGLSITNRIVTRHGGRIRVQSVPGQGARFIVELPLAGPGGAGV